MEVAAVEKRPPPGKRVAILQSNYIPWKGYFDLMDSVDEFVLLDTVQFTNGDWRNRNRVKTREGPAWLTIPVRKSGRFPQRICDTECADASWPKKHLKRLLECLHDAGCFAEEAPFVAELYETSPTRWLSEVNRHFIERIAQFLGITTRLSSATTFPECADRNERLVRICSDLGAAEYVSGPAARAYLDESLFHRAGIAVRWFDYAGFPEYPQVHPPFDHAVTVLDAIFHLGKDAAGAVLRRPATTPSSAAAIP